MLLINILDSLSLFNITNRQSGHMEILIFSVNITTGIQIFSAEVAQSGFLFGCKVYILCSVGIGYSLFRDA